MNYRDNQLFSIIQTVRRRRQSLAALRGLTLSLAASAVLLILTGLAAFRFRHSSGALVSLRLAALFGVIAAVYLFIARPLRKRVSDAQVARLIEERHRGLEDRLVSAVEVADESARAASPAIVDRLVDDASRRVAEVSPDEIIPKQKLWRLAGAAAGCVALFIGALFFGPRQLSSGVAQLVAPTSAEAAANALKITVKPGTARVPKGSDQQITATLINFNADLVTFFFRKAGADDTQWVGQPMEPAKNKSDYQHFIFNIQDSVEYFVESNGVKTAVFKLEAADLPYVKRIDLKLDFPAYTGLPSKTMEDSGDVAALKGTVATITAKLTGKVKSAFIVLKDGKKIEMKPSEQRLESGEVENLLVGAVTVTENTSYHIELTSVDGDVYNGSNEHDITLLEDQPPTVSFEKPGRDTRATSIEEIFTQAKAEDDYGVSSLELYYSVNGGEEKKVDLQKLKGAARTLTGAHTFFLEEFGLQPGDFISYYAKARDAHSEATSDIYFIEIKPFEREFRQAQQQGGGGGGQQDQNALTKRQKEIIAATFRVNREQTGYSAGEKTENYSAVALSQERLRDDAQALIERIKRRMGGQLEEQKEFAKLLEHLTEAAKEMNNAIPELRGQKADKALPPEQRALQQLLRADAIFREMQVAMGQQDGQGSSNSNAEELADLFELELDKMKNQYETLKREQQQQGQQQDDETKRKLEELARRQQKELEQQQRRQQGARNQSGGGGGGRQQQELIDETRKAARELERLSRERRDQQLQDLSRQLNQAADEMQRAQAAGQNQNQQEAIAQNLRALEKIEEARRRMDQLQRSRGGQSAQDLKQRAADAAARQQQIQKDVEELARKQQQNGNQNDQATQEAKRRLGERKEALANDVGNLEKDIDQAARGAGQDQQKVADQMREAASSLRRNRVSERIRRNNENIQNGQLSAAREGERVIQENLNQVAQQLKEAEQSAKNQKGAGGETEDSLDRTRQLADNLESIRRKMGENKGQQSQQGSPQNQGKQQSAGNQTQQGQPGKQGQQPGRPGQQPNGQQNGNQQGNQAKGQQPGQQPGQQGNQPGQQPNGQQSGSQSGQRSAQNGNQQSPNNSQQLSRTPQGGGPPQGGTRAEGSERQMRSELAERLREAEELRKQLGREGGNLTRELDQAIQQLRQMTEDLVRGDDQTAARLKAEVIDPLRQIEFELSRKLQAKLGKSNLRLSDEGAAPERYRKQVEEYYKRLSTRSATPK
ncbi:MAG TPA: DUF4175 family protein [Blastocatellia bacterium]|nr:DUF4175 family protein [Blastocatellia bacterium]